MEVRTETVTVVFGLVKECLSSGAKGADLQKMVLEKVGDLKNLNPEDLIKEFVQIFEKMSDAESAAKSCFASIMKLVRK